MAGDVVAGHQLTRLLGVGGMGEVYLARHQTLGVARAIKVIRTDLRGRDKARERFTREAQVLARLQHNSIVQIIELGSLANGWPFLAMEYIDGPSLDDLAEHAPLSIPNALVVLEQMALALRHAHASNVIHRDLKPSNVLVRHGDLQQVKIIDFGLARILDGDGGGERLTADGMTIGAPAYMAPELAEGVRDVTAATDIYSLACIAYRLISQKPPFLDRKRLALMAAHVHEMPPRLSQRAAGVPVFLDDLLVRCLAKDPALRPAADEVAAKIGEYLRGAHAVGTGVSNRAVIEHVEVPWKTAATRRNIAAEVLDMPVPQDPADRGLALATAIMWLVEEIATYLSTSDPELTSLLRLEARISEQLTSIERDLAGLVTQLAVSPGTPALEQQRQALHERIRTLNAQQLPLQRRMVEVVEAYRYYASGPIKTLFIQMDRALDELAALRRGPS